MSPIATTRMSSKGQIVIPEAIRDQLGLKAGSQFVVLAEKGTVILKSIEPPSLDEFDELIAEARKQAQKASLKQADIKAAIAKTHSPRFKTCWQFT